MKSIANSENALLKKSNQLNGGKKTHPFIKHVNVEDPIKKFCCQ